MKPGQSNVRKLRNNIRSLPQAGMKSVRHSPSAAMQLRLVHNKTLQRQQHLQLSNVHCVPPDEMRCVRFNLSITTWRPLARNRKFRNQRLRLNNVERFRLLLSVPPPLQNVRWLRRAARVFVRPFRLPLNGPPRGQSRRPILRHQAIHPAMVVTGTATNTTGSKPAL